MPESQLQLKEEGAEAACANSDTQYVLENEIECPRCHDDMTLCSEFDNLYYFCEVCDFCLFTLKT
jgi:hypothetical protein